MTSEVSGSTVPPIPKGRLEIQPILAYQYDFTFLDLTEPYPPRKDDREMA